LHITRRQRHVAGRGIVTATLAIVRLSSREAHRCLPQRNAPRIFPALNTMGNPFSSSVTQVTPS